ncbi:MAG: hypothetical protein HYR60_29435 [Acidobacteria bacterium]|nr:hypothetical protein [Acidobacteriota bacterium]
MAAPLRQLLRTLVPRKWQRNLVYLRDLSERLDLIEATADRAAQGLASVLARRGMLQIADGQCFADFEYRIRSQGGEDGILQYLFDCVGTVDRTFVEFGIQSGRECNAAHLSLSCGWRGLFIEGDHRLAEWARDYYDRMLGPAADRVRIANRFITTDNINSILAENGVSGQIDLLSIDIDGNDYWIWEAISAVSARVVVVEYNAVFGPTRSVTIPYSPSFRRSGMGRGMYYGASLGALCKLGARKGYSLVGCGSNGINAFFVNRSLVTRRLSEAPSEKAFRPHSGWIHSKTVEEQFDLVKELPLVEV